MELLALDNNLDGIGIVDVFESLIWTDRYCDYGDFEIYTPIDDNIINTIRSDYYLWLTGSDKVMIVESNTINTDAENGNHLIFQGRSLESILERRIIWKQTILSGDFQTGIEKLLNENIINPIVPNRKIPNFIFEASTDLAITQLTIEAQFTGVNLFDAIKASCGSKNIGFKITLTDDKKFKFKLYSGVDRSYNNPTNEPYVVFSPKFDNLLNSNYVESKKTLKTVTLVAGEGEGKDRKTVTVEKQIGGEYTSGLDRREMFTDARDVSSNVDDGTLSDTDYKKLLTQRGSEQLAENNSIEIFEGQAEMTQLYKYDEDFFMGDIVQIRNEFGFEAKSRITEAVISQSSTGIDTIPTFSAI